MQELPKTVIHETIKVFETPRSSVYQCDDTESYHLHLFEDEIALKLCELITFKRKIEQIDLAELLSSDSPDLEIVSLVKSGRVFAFSIYEVLELRDLLSGTLTMLELNSLIHKQIHRRFF